MLVWTSACMDSTLEITFKDGLADTDWEQQGKDSGDDAQLPFDAIGSADEGVDLSGGADASLSVSRLAPATGPATGGNVVTVVGSGFEEGSQVFIGDKAVDPAKHELLNENEIRIIVPAGEIGTFSVTVRGPGGVATRREDAYTYHGLTIEPDEGARAGGTLVEILLTGDPVDDSVRVWFGDTECENQVLLTPHRIRCSTPPGRIGAVDVSVRSASGETAEGRLAPDGFSYVDPTASAFGGFGGGPIRGTVNVTVVDSMSQLGLPGAQVALGGGTELVHLGVTNERGQLVLSAEELKGPIDLHVAADCFQRTSVRALDARDVTLFLDPSLEPRCLPENQDMLEGGGGVVVASVGSRISGEIIFTGSEEFNANAWNVVPRARDTEVRVTYVYATHSGLFGRNVSPSARPFTLERLVEDSAIVGERGGYEYTIAARPAGLAVYALAGIERADTGEFVPYVMGVARNLVTSPGADLEGIDIHMDLPLDRKQQVTLANIPPPPPIAPREFRVRLAIDLGAEGMIRRESTAAMLDLARATSVAEPFSFFGQPPFSGPLADARYAVVSGWYSGPSYQHLPYTEAIHLGVAPSNTPELVDDFLGIPMPVEPHDGGPLPDDRTLRWEATGTPADFYIVQLVSREGVPLWNHIVPGDVFDVSLPDFSAFEGLADLPSGYSRWMVRGVRVPGFEFGQFNYSQLSARRWTHDAVDEFLFIR